MAARVKYPGFMWLVVRYSYLILLLSLERVSNAEGICMVWSEIIMQYINISAVESLCWTRQILFCEGVTLACFSINSKNNF